MDLRAMFFHRFFETTFVKSVSIFDTKVDHTFCKNPLIKPPKNIEGMEVFSFSLLRSQEKLKTSIPSMFLDGFMKGFLQKVWSTFVSKMYQLLQKLSPKKEAKNKARYLLGILHSSWKS